MRRKLAVTPKQRMAARLRWGKRALDSALGTSTMGNWTLTGRGPGAKPGRRVGPRVSPGPNTSPGSPRGRKIGRRMG